MKAILAVAIAFAACKPMYGEPAERLHKDKIDRRIHADDKVVEIDACEIDFVEPPVKAAATSPRTAAVRGEAAVQRAKEAPTDAAKNEQWLAAVLAFRDALIADPYDAAATLELARAYDALYHRGCALALLRRLAKLESNPSLSPGARREIQRVADNDGWFARYRKDALAAIGR